MPSLGDSCLPVRSPVLHAVQPGGAALLAGRGVEGECLVVAHPLKEQVSNLDPVRLLPVGLRPVAPPGATHASGGDAERFVPAVTVVGDLEGVKFTVSTVDGVLGCVEGELDGAAESLFCGHRLPRGRHGGVQEVVEEVGGVGHGFSEAPGRDMSVALLGATATESQFGRSGIAGLIQAGVPCCRIHGMPCICECASPTKYPNLHLTQCRHKRRFKHSSTIHASRRDPVPTFNLLPNHPVTIDTRYGETTRDCYCTVTNGLTHHEGDFPWLGPSQVADEKPLDVPMRTGEGIDEYLERVHRGETWAQGFMAHLMFSLGENPTQQAIDAALMLAALAGIRNPYRDHESISA